MAPKRPASRADQCLRIADEQTCLRSGSTAVDDPIQTFARAPFKDMDYRPRSPLRSIGVVALGFVADLGVGYVKSDQLQALTASRED